MRNFIVLCFTLSSLVASAAVQEAVLGNVVALERNFGRPDQTAVLAALAPMGANPGYYVAEITLMPNRENESLVSSTQAAYVQGDCWVKIVSGNFGYGVIAYLNRTDTTHENTRDKAVACVDQAFQTGRFELLVMKTVIHTVQ